MDNRFYSFSVDDAVKYGAEEAIILLNLRYWIDKNKANEKHFYNGKYWTYNSVKAFCELFPFWSAKQIRRILESLKEKGAIETGNFNNSPYDRTIWYCLAENGKTTCENKNYDLPKWENGKPETGEPIPYIKPNTKPNIKTNTTSGDKAPREEKAKEPKKLNNLQLFANAVWDRFESRESEYTESQKGFWFKRNARCLRDILGFCEQDIELALETISVCCGVLEKAGLTGGYEAVCRNITNYYPEALKRVNKRRNDGLIGNMMKDITNN